MHALIRESLDKFNSDKKIRRQKLTIKKYPVWRIEYMFGNKKYELFLKSTKREAQFIRSPFFEMAEEAFVSGRARQ